MPKFMSKPKMIEAVKLEIVITYEGIDYLPGDWLVVDPEEGQYFLIGSEFTAKFTEVAHCIPSLWEVGSTKPPVIEYEFSNNFSDANLEFMDYEEYGELESDIMAEAEKKPKKDITDILTKTFPLPLSPVYDPSTLLSPMNMNMKCPRKKTKEEMQEQIEQEMELAEFKLNFYNDRLEQLKEQLSRPTE